MENVIRGYKYSGTSTKNEDMDTSEKDTYVLLIHENFN